MHLVRHIRAHNSPLCAAYRNMALETYFWILSSSIHCLGHFHANCVFSPRRKVLTVLYLTKHPVLWFIRPFLPAWHSHKTLSTIPELLNLSLQGTPRSSSGDINFGKILLGNCMAKHWWKCSIKGILKRIFSMKSSQVSHFLFSFVCFSFLYSFHSVYLFIVTKAQP